MKRPVLFAVVLGALSITSHVSDAANPRDQYLCVSDKRIVFEYDNRLDAAGAVTVHARKYFLISTPSSHDSDVAFFITEAGGPSPSGYCEYGFNDWGILFCDIRTAQLKFNKYNGRFITVFTGGYDAFPHGAYMETGKCSNLRSHE